MTDKQSPDDGKATLRAVAHGYVQGVGFRVFIRSHAWNLGVKGYVRNLMDGTVQVVASGPRQRLESLLAEIRCGPAGAYITSVDTVWSDGEAPGLAPKFEVRH